MSAQLEDGYTRTANELLDHLMQTRLNGTQHSIIYCVIRNTYGFQRKSHALSLTYISTATKIHKDLVKRELDKLIESKVITVFKEAGFRSTREIGVNKNTEEWHIYSEPKSRQSTNQSTVSESVYIQSTNQSTPTVDESVYQERKSFKENLKEKYIAQFEEFWKLYPEKKGKSKAITKWLTLAPKFDFEKVMQGTRNYIEFIEHGKANGKTRDYKDGSTFVNQESWNDDWNFSGKPPINPNEKRGLILTDAYDGHYQDSKFEPYDNTPGMTDEERELNLFAYKKSG